MLALCLMLLATYYAQNYAGIIGWPLAIRQNAVEALVFGIGNSLIPIEISNKV